MQIETYKGLTIMLLYHPLKKVRGTIVQNRIN